MEDCLKLFDYAAVDAGRIPDYVLKGEELENRIELLRERWTRGPMDENAPMGSIIDN